MITNSFKNVITFFNKNTKNYFCFVSIESNIYMITNSFKNVITFFNKNTKSIIKNIEIIKLNKKNIKLIFKFKIQNYFLIYINYEI